MKLGCSWNVFDGEELLEGSIRQIRKEVDYVSVVYQTSSNFGNPCSSELIPLLQSLKSAGLVEDLYEFTPESASSAQQNEIKKRNVGLELSRSNGCTHHMSLDTDEYFIESEFIKLKQIMMEGDFDSSFSQMKTYYKTPEFQLTPPENYHVSLIYRIFPDSEFVMWFPTPVLIDPTRRMSTTGNTIVLPREEIEMHHLSFVRRDLSIKLKNSSVKFLFSDKIDKIVRHYDNWVYPNKVMWAKGDLLNVKRVKNIFEIKL